MAQRVFISYSRKDLEFVKRLAADLEARGLAVWLDKGDIHPGADWRKALVDAVTDCAAFLLVLSPDSVKSQYVQQELAMAEAHKKAIIPLFYRQTKVPPTVEAQIGDHQYIWFNKGGYAENFADLARGLVALGVALKDAPEMTPAEMDARRRAILTDTVKVKWGAVFGKAFGWAAAWALGWGLFWVVFPLLVSLFGDGEAIEDFALFPVGGLVGGAIGGLLAGLFTMFALRRNAPSIGWKHMAASIRIWGIVGPVGAAAAGILGTLSVDVASIIGGGECAGLEDCFGQIIGGAIAAFVVLAFVFVIAMLGTVFAVGLFAGGLAVRHIRRLEPGILGKQAAWVVIGWGLGAILAVIASVSVIGVLGGTG
ncbi:MAG: toll/interleukin-1 receptor domain-containing protein [Anaerolineae bacterium]|nr:MAG: toll/interleukin-1 receptor domain-containing protein [Anaerolineae bacterium]